MNCYRADHVGSFLRPAELLRARKERVPLGDLEALEEKHIVRVLERFIGSAERYSDLVIVRVWKVG
jgi:methionine synthase II (cobalamin-independent)